MRSSDGSALDLPASSFSGRRSVAGAARRSISMNRSDITGGAGGTRRLRLCRPIYCELLICLYFALGPLDGSSSGYGRAGTPYPTAATGRRGRTIGQHRSVTRRPRTGSVRQARRRRLRARRVASRRTPGGQPRAPRHNAGSGPLRPQPRCCSLDNEPASSLLCKDAATLRDPGELEIANLGYSPNSGWPLRSGLRIARRGLAGQLLAAGACLRFGFISTCGFGSGSVV